MFLIGMGAAVFLAIFAAGLVCAIRENARKRKGLPGRYPESHVVIAHPLHRRHDG